MQKSWVLRDRKAKIAPRARPQFAAPQKPTINTSAAAHRDGGCSAPRARSRSSSWLGRSCHSVRRCDTSFYPCARGPHSEHSDGVRERKNVLSAWMKTRAHNPRAPSPVGGSGAAPRRISARTARPSAPASREPNESLGPAQSQRGTSARANCRSLTGTRSTHLYTCDAARPTTMSNASFHTEAPPICPQYLPMPSLHCGEFLTYLLPLLLRLMLQELGAWWS
jgi:hypothetical protein